MRTDVIFPLENRRVWVAGHLGMVGSALVRRLEGEGCEVLTADRAGVDLRRQEKAEAWIREAKPDAIFLAAGKVGGIVANDSYPAEFLYDNLMIAANVIHAAHRQTVSKLLFLGSSCIYPRLAAQPIAEEALLTGPLEPTNEWYAVAKIAGIKLCQAYRKEYGDDFIAAMPTNLYGPEDNFDLDSAHVLPALLRKAHEAKLRGDRQLVIWGSGFPRREFLHVDDCADALVYLMKSYSAAQHVNIGSGEDQTIFELAQIVCDVVGFRGEIVRDTSKPDGMPRKLMSSKRLLNTGWAPKIGLREGLESTYAWYLRRDGDGNGLRSAVGG
ncbi:MAG: GDP-L-fucose synthase [Caulobacteraceae bacterium]|nr:GDP-L-fucose synthase [Caulobacteraceae bacterium]